MSICIGCLVAAGSFAGVGGLGGVTQWLAERRRQRAMRAVLDAPPSEVADAAPGDAGATRDDGRPR